MFEPTTFCIYTHTSFRAWHSLLQDCLLQQQHAGLSYSPASFHFSWSASSTTTLSLPSGSQPAARGTSSNRSSLGSPTILLAAATHWSASRSGGDLVLLTPHA
ncbi:hypothetical protein V8C42DRAFT_328621 [Trichoderma barbatum]